MQQYQGYSGMDPNEVRRDLRATRSAMREAGPEHDDEFVDLFVQKFTQQMMLQVRGEIQQQMHGFSGGGSASAGMRLALAIVSICMLVPLTAIILGTLNFVGLIGLGLVSLAIMVINIVFNLRH